MTSHESRRPEIAPFVNGISFAVAKGKRYDLKDALDQGVSQHLRNQRTDEIPHLFIFSQLFYVLFAGPSFVCCAGEPETWGKVFSLPFEILKRLGKLKT